MTHDRAADMLLTTKHVIQPNLEAAEVNVIFAGRPEQLLEAEYISVAVAGGHVDVYPDGAVLFFPAGAGAGQYLRYES